MEENWSTSRVRQIAAGATLYIKKAFVSYPASLWKLNYVLNLAGKVIAQIPGPADPNSPNQNSFIVTLPAAQTAAWLPGEYNFADIVTQIAAPNAVERANYGSIIVTPNYAIDTPKTISQKQLEEIDCMISKLLGKQTRSVNFNGQQFEEKDLKQIFDIRDRIQARVDADLTRLGLSKKGNIKRFVTRFYG